MPIESHTYWLEAPYQLVSKSEFLDEEHLAPDAILCESIISAISPGTEIAAYTGMAPLRPGKAYPRLVGYCNVSQVLKCGREVTNTKPGERILTFSSHRSYFIISEQDVLTVIPENISSEHASCTYLYHLGYDAILKSDIRYGSTVVVIGLGVLGLNAIAMAVNAGANVYAVSNHDKPTDIALKLGAINVFKRNKIDQLENTLGRSLANTVISTTNSWSDWEVALQLSGANGSISVLGFPGRGVDNIPINPLSSQFFYSKQLKIQAVGLSPENNDSRNFLPFNEKSNLTFLLQQIENKKLNPDLIISDIWPWHQLQNAYDSLVTRHNSPITYLLQWKD